MPGVLAWRANRVAPVLQSWQPCIRHQRLVSDDARHLHDSQQPVGLAPPCIGGPGVAAQCIRRPPLPRLIPRASVPVRSSAEVRNAFLDYFADEHHHRRVDPIPLIPVSRDEGSYFVNSGMMQFKPIFLGQKKPQSFAGRLRRATNSQRCARLGGKHNDLDDVGRDGTHLTLFEMLGSWSFGDYGREKACAMAWDFLTNVLCLPPANLYVTYFGGDKELGIPADAYTRDVWLNLGVSDSRMMPFGKKDNFWEMADYGPCGPCTEIHFDLIGGGRCARCFVNEDNPEVVEVWNLVFMEYERLQGSGLVRPLAQRHVDTGMGLERMSSIVQGVTSAYDTDLFTGLMDGLHARSDLDRPYGGEFGEGEEAVQDTAYRIVADHLRLAGVALADGLLPSKRGLGLKLRAVLHRAIRQARERLQLPPGSLADLAPILAESLESVRPGIHEHGEQIREVLLAEEEAFLPRLRSVNAAFKHLMESRPASLELTADEVATVMQEERCTFDLVRLLAQEHGLTAAAPHELLDGEVELRESPLYHQPRRLARKLQEMSLPATRRHDVYDYFKNRKGRYEFPVQDAKVLAVVGPDGLLEDGATSGTRCAVVLDSTAFYATAGGQESDCGLLTVNLSRQQPQSLFRVERVSSAGPFVLHEGVVETDEEVRPNQAVRLQVDSDRRLGLMQHHTGTHVLNFCLRDLFGSGRVKQTHSLVQPDRLSFGFACVAPCGLERLEAMEEHSRQMIRASLPVLRHTVPVDEAAANPHILRLDGHSYPANVHIISMGDNLSGLQRLQRTHPSQVPLDHSPLACAELCGGTHVHNTADLVDLVVLSLRGANSYYKEVEVMVGHPALGVRARGEELRLEAADLARRVKTKEDRERWGERLRCIDQVVGRELLPKTTRDRILELLAPLRRLITASERAAANRDRRATENEAIEAAMKECDRFPVTVVQLEIANVSKLVKALHKLEPSQPILLVDLNPHAKSRRFVIYVPSTSAPVTAENMAQRLCDLVNSDQALGSPPLTYDAGVGKLGAHFVLCYGGSEEVYEEARLLKLSTQLMLESPSE